MSSLNEMIRALQASQSEGRPGQPTYIGMDPASLNLADQARTMFGGVKVNSDPMNRYTSIAMSEGPTKGASLAMSLQKKTAATARDDAKRQALGEAATAKTSLATRGGLRGGAAERLDTAMADKSMDVAQQTRDQSARNILNIGMQDETNKQNMLGQSVGMQQNAANFDLNKQNNILSTMNNDVGRQMQANAQQNAWNANTYNQQMQAWGANKQANATANAGKK